MVVADQVRLALTIGCGDWPTSALPGGGSCRYESGGVVAVKGKRIRAASAARKRSRRRDWDGFRKRRQQTLGREGDTRCRARGGFQSVFTHERHTTSGDTLRSRCEGESSLFARRLTPFLALRGNHLYYALNPRTIANFHRCRK